MVKNHRSVTLKVVNNVNDTLKFEDKQYLY